MSTPSLPFYRIAYVSSASEELSLDDFRKIEEISVRNNRMQEIYGVLVTDGRRIIQVLEGQRNSIEQLMEKIYNDPRHHSVKIFAEDTTEEISFKQWFMNVIDVKNRPANMQTTFEAMFDVFANAPIKLKLDAQRLEFFRNIATWS